MAIESGIATALYGKDGDNRYKISPETTAAQTLINDESGNASTVESEIEKLRTSVTAIQNDGIRFKGSLTSTNGLPTVAYKAGWQYAVQEAGTYAGQTCEVGDMVLCVKDYASGSASNSDWAVIQANIVGSVTGPGTAIANHVASFDGTSGKIIKDSGYTIAKSVPADAQFTDTTYSEATTSAAGLMSSSDKSKLNGIATGADVTSTATVKAAGAFMKASDTADSISDGTSKVLMTAAERSKLSALPAGAQANQNAFSNIKVGTKTMSATSTTDTFTMSAGSGLTLTAGTKAVTIAESYVDSCIVASLDNVPSNLRNGGLIILKQ